MPVGRKPKPVELHKLNGTFRLDRHARAKPPIELGWPQCPDRLSDDVRAIWDELETLLRPVTTDRDSTAIELLCVALRDWRALTAEVAVNGRTYTTVTNSGATMRRPSPLVALRDEAERRLRASLADFGMSPAARARLGLPEKPQRVNPFAVLKEATSA